MITVEQFRKLARPTSAHVDEEDVLSYVRECEDSYIIPSIGWARFKAATDSGDWGDSVAKGFIPDTFLDGGEYGDDGERYTNGIRKALAYYVYAKMTRADGSILSRAGAMRHMDDYSQHYQDSGGNKQYNDIMDMAEKYLSNALEYLRLYTNDGEVKKQRGTRAHIHAIGD